MSELTQVLERESERFDLPPGGLDRLFRRRRRRQRNQRISAGLVALLVAALSVWGAVRATSSLAPEEQRPARPDVRHARVAATIHIPVGAGAPGWVAYVHGSLWVSAYSSPTLTKIDGRTNRVIAQIEVVKESTDATGGHPEYVAGPPALAAGFGSVWVVHDGRSIQRIDPATNKVVATIPVGLIPQSIVAAVDSIWVWSSGSQTFSRINPSDNRVVATIPATLSPTGLGSAWATDPSGSVWYWNEEKHSLNRVDPTTNEVVTSMAFADSAAAIVAIDDRVWVASSQHDLIYQIDPDTLAVEGRIFVEGSPTAVASSDRFLWVLSVSERTVTAYDTKDGSRLVRLPVGSGASYLVAAGRSVWVSNAAEGTVTRIDLGPRP